MSKSYHNLNLSQVQRQEIPQVIGKNASPERYFNFVIICLTSTIKILNKTDLRTLNYFIEKDNQLRFMFMSRSKIAKDLDISLRQLATIIKKLKDLFLIDVISSSYNTSLYNINIFFTVPKIREEFAIFLPALREKISKENPSRKALKKALQYHDSITERVRSLEQEDCTHIYRLLFESPKKRQKNCTPILLITYSLFLKSCYLSKTLSCSMINSLYIDNISVRDQFTICKRELKRKDDLENKLNMSLKVKEIFQEKKNLEIINFKKEIINEEREFVLQEEDCFYEETEKEIINTQQRRIKMDIQQQESSKKAVMEKLEALIKGNSRFIAFKSIRVSDLEEAFNHIDFSTDFIKAYHLIDGIRKKNSSKGEVIESTSSFKDSSVVSNLTDKVSQKKSCGSHTLAISRKLFITEQQAEYCFKGFSDELIKETVEECAWGEKITTFMQRCNDKRVSQCQ